MLIHIRQINQITYNGNKMEEILRLMEWENRYSVLECSGNYIIVNLLKKKRKESSILLENMHTIKGRSQFYISILENGSIYNEIYVIIIKFYFKYRDS